MMPGMIENRDDKMKVGQDSGPLSLPNTGISWKEDMAQNSSTTKLLNKVKRAGSLDDAIFVAGKGTPALGEYLTSLLEDKGLERPAVIKEAGIDATFGYQIFKGSRGASRDKVLAICLVMGCNLRETNRALKVSGSNELYARNRRDVIIIYAIENGFSLAQANDALYEHNEDTIS